MSATQPRNTLHRMDQGQVVPVPISTAPAVEPAMMDLSALGPFLSVPATGDSCSFFWDAIVRLLEQPGLLSGRRDMAGGLCVSRRWNLLGFSRDGAIHEAGELIPYS